MPEYYRAPSLTSLVKEVDTLWPKRDKASDGWIGDPSHKARLSDHNPDYADGGVVRAIDIDVSDIDVQKVIAVLKKDSRVNYFIYNRKIYGANNFVARPYDGSNPHTKHIHVSIKHTKAAEKAGAWGLLGSVSVVSKPKPITDGYPLLYRGVSGKGDAIYKLQKDLNRVFPTYSKFKGDRDFGPYMVQVVKEFQKRSGLKADGVVGSNTWKALARVGVKP